MSKRKEYVLASVFVVLMILMAGFAEKAPAISLILCVPIIRLWMYLCDRYEDE